jgi:hypothetical protein
VSIRLGDLPAWVAAVGTVGALIAALVQIKRERDRRIRQEEKDREERHQEQARLVSGWVGTYEPVPWDDPDNPAPIVRYPMYLQNSSNEPIYNVLTTVVTLQAAGTPRTGEEWSAYVESMSEHEVMIPRTTAVILPPGRWRVWVVSEPVSAMQVRLAAEVAFTDRSGVHWVRRSDGALEQLEAPPFEYFQVSAPYDLVTPEPPPFE